MKWSALEGVRRKLLDALSYDFAEKNRAAAVRTPSPRRVARRGALVFAGLLLALATSPVAAANGSASALDVSPSLPLTAEMPEQGSGATRQGVVTLRPAEKLRQSISGGEAHAFRVSLTSGQYLHVSVEQQGMDVVLTLFGADNQPVLSVDNPNGQYGPESASLVAPSSGEYLIEVKAGRALAPPGFYTIEIEEPRTPGQAETVRVSAERAIVQGRKLASETSLESKRRAVERFEAAITLWESLQDAQQEAYAWVRLGWARRDLGEAEQFADALRRALAILERVADRRGQAAVLNEIGAAKRASKEPLQAVPIYERAVGIRHEAGDRWGEAQLLNNIGFIYARTGQMRTALKYYGDALTLWREVGDREYEARVRNNMAGAYTELGETQSALETYQSVLEFCLSTKNKSLEAYVRNNIAEIYDFRGESLKAVVEYEQAAALFRETNDPAGEVLALNNLGMLYAGWGDAQRAIDYFTRAPELRERVTDLRAKAATLYGLGYAYAVRDSYTPQATYDEALGYYERALPAHQQAQNRQGIAATLIGIGTIYNARGEPQTALRYFQEALAIQEQVGDVRGQASALERIGDTRRRAGELAKARDSFDKSYAAWHSVGDRQGEASSLYGMAEVAHAQNNLFEALRRIEGAIGIVESLRTTTTNSQMRMLYFATKRDYYDLNIDIRMQLHRRFPSERHDEAALNASERARARSLFDTLAEARAGIGDDFDAELSERGRRLQRALNDKARVLLRERGLKRHEQAAALDREIAALMVEHEDVQARMRAKSRAYANLTRPGIAGLKEIQRDLLSDKAAKTVLLEYALGRRRSYVWVVTGDRLFTSELPGRAEIEKAAGRVRDFLTARQPRRGEHGTDYVNRVRRADAEYWDSARELRRLVLDRVAPQLKGARRLLIVADGGLQLIPFAALPASTQAARAPSSARAGSESAAEADVPLAAKYEIVHQPSASTIRVLKTGARTAPPKAVAVFADPVFNKNDARLSRLVVAPASDAVRGNATELEQALRDVGDVVDISNLPRLTYTGDEATGILAISPPAASLNAVGFKANRAAAASPELASYRFVHFATHAVPDDDHPALSGLVLSLVDERGLPQDGFLRLHDIYNLRLNSDLVVLSACQTGVGKDVKGEGLINLTRGFMYAGSRGVVVSLWAVKDAATADLMKRFYKHLLVGKKKPAAALSAAQMEVRSQEGWAPPFFWAGFVLQGDWE
jgi:CHAT domain-containing protein/Tfp pilus assembly protein PilF